MASELCMNCFGVKGQYEICPHCGYAEGTPPAQPHYLAPGTILANHFILGTVIGAGGFGIIYKCYDTTLGVIVAVKEFFPVGLVNRAPGENSVGLFSGEKKEQYQEQIKRFLMEAQSIAQFGKAKDIVNVYDFFEENNTAYIIMEYVDGVLLKDYLEKQGRMDAGTALRIINPVVEAVKKIHAKGIIHRDISPDNIFIADQNAVKIFDFGAAMLGDEGAAGEKVIKMGYSAPEQYRDNRRQGFYTDIYAIGAILYQMVTGMKPPESTEREFKDEMKSPLALGVKIDANLDRAIMEAMAVQPELRFQNVQQLDEAIHGKRIAEYPAQKLKKRRRKRNAIAGVSALAIIAVVVGVALISTVYKPGNIMFDTQVKKDTVTVWVDSAAAYTTFSEMVDSEEGSMNKIQPQDSEAVVQMKKENQEVTYHIWNVTVEDESHKEAYASMEEALKAAEDKKEQLPDVFMTDNVSDLGQYDLVSYEDNVYKSIAEEKYLYLADYQENMREMWEMPTSIDVLLLYAIDTGSENADITTIQREAFQKRDIVPSTLVRGKYKYTDTIPLEDILAANESGKEYTYMDTRSAVLLSILDDTEGFDWQEGELNFDGNLVQSLDSCLIMRSQAMEKAKWKTSEKAKTHYGNSILAGAGYRSVLNGEKIGNVAIPYQVLVPTVDGKMLVQYSGKLAIVDNADENKRVAAMRFVYFAMGQQQSAADKDMAFPISDVDYQKGKFSKTNSAFREFFESNSRQGVVRDLIEEQSYPCMLVAKGTGNIVQFAKGLEEKKVPDMAGLEEYCRSYAEEQKKKE